MDYSRYIQIETLQFGKDWGVKEFTDGQNLFWIESDKVNGLLDIQASITNPSVLDIVLQMGGVIPDISTLFIKYQYGGRSDKMKEGSRSVANVSELALDNILFGFAEYTNKYVFVPHSPYSIEGQFTNVKIEDVLNLALVANFTSIVILMKELLVDLSILADVFNKSIRDILYLALKKFGIR